MSHKKSIDEDQWNEKLGQIHIQKEDIDKLVMDFLIEEGFKSAVEHFKIESNMNYDVKLTSLDDRASIRKAIQEGDIDGALQLVNGISSEILSNDKVLFTLKLQKLLEMIKLGKLEQAIEYAQDELAKYGEIDKEYLDEIEKAMSLLIFETDEKSTNSDMLEMGHRQKTATLLNSELLASTSQENGAKLPLLIKMLIWGQGRLDQRVTFPHVHPE